MKKIRKSHSEAFKAKVALEAAKGERTMAELSREYGVHPMQISKWKRLLLERLPEIFSRNGSGREPDQEALVSRLYQQIGELQVQLDWLKKKSSFLG